MSPLLDLARVVRSKNAGPYEIVLDILFKDRATFDWIRSSGQLDAARIAAVYGIPLEAVHRIIWFEPANAVKIVMPRRIVSGAAGDTDVYGAQQHAPLLDLRFESGSMQER